MPRLPMAAPQPMREPPVAKEIDFGRSVPFRFDRTLGKRFIPLRDYLTGEVFRFHNLGIPKIKVIEQITSAIDCVLANFLDARRISPKCFVAISLSEASFKSGRYHQVGFGYTNFRRVLEFLRGANPPYVIHKPGFYDRRNKIPTGRVSRFAPTEYFLKLLSGYNHVIDSYLVTDSFGMDEVLTSAISYSDTNPLPTSGKISIPFASTNYCQSADCIRLRNSEKQLAPYDDNEATQGMRERLRRWNEFISEHHHVDLLMSDKEIEHLYENDNALAEDIFFEDNEDKPQFVEFERVRLHRVFNNGSFDQGGRFYGGWWQGVPSRYRKYITINEHLTTEYDFSNLHAAMLYARKGLPLNADAYQLDGIEQTKANRSLIKTTFLKLVNARADQTIQRPKSGLPAHWSWPQLQERIIAKHSPIAEYFRSGIGLQLQKVDSEIAEQVMLRMMENDLLALPIHDSFITYHELRATLLEEMKRAYQDRMHSEIGVDADPSFLDEFLVNCTPPVGDWDALDHRQDQPGYESYRERHRVFFRTRNDNWHSRFSG